MEDSSFLWTRDRRFVLFGLQANETSWRSVALLALVFLGSLVFAAALLPLIEWAIGWAASRLDPQLAEGLFRHRTDKLFEVLRWLPVLVGLPWVMWICQLWSLPALGLGPTGHVARTLGVGFAVGVALVCVLAAGQLTLGTAAVGSRAEVTLLQLAKWIAISLASAAIVGVVEETIFRGLILRIFYTSTRYAWLALTLSAAFFAYTHFKIPTSEWSKVGDVHWYTGWLAAYWTLIGISVDFELKRFLALWFLGMVLGALALRQGSLWPGIGLHSGLVFALLLYRHLVGDFGQLSGFWGSTSLIDGWAVVCALAVLFAVIVAKPARLRTSIVGSPWRGLALPATFNQGVLPSNSGKEQAI